MKNKILAVGTAPNILQARGVAMIVMLVAQFATGALLDSSAKLPLNHPGTTGSFLGRGWHGYAWSITNGGGAALTTHTVLATMLVLGAIATLIFAKAAHHKAWIIASVVGLIAVCAAFYNGLVFVDTNLDVHSAAMALATVVALAAYITGLFLASRKLN